MIDPVHKQHTCDPSLTVGSPHDTQPLLVDLVFLEGPWVLRVVHQQGLDLQVAACIGTEEQGQTVLHGLVARQLGLLLCDESPFGHPLPKQSSLVAVEDLLWNVALRLHNLQELRCKVFSRRNIRTGSLSMPEKNTQASRFLQTPPQLFPQPPSTQKFKSRIFLKKQQSGPMVTENHKNAEKHTQASRFLQTPPQLFPQSPSTQKFKSRIFFKKQQSGPMVTENHKNAEKHTQASRFLQTPPQLFPQSPSTQKFKSRIFFKKQQSGPMVTENHKNLGKNTQASRFLQTPPQHQVLEFQTPQPKIQNPPKKF
ncbi:uncharacterized protein LOC128410440 [Podarcis raffonei]|uniref:uncharacterized protein LOC128410440 n=1 Tax=Podarcis raffonei TaxID=65483 RepID=UPI0023292B34|nr:uncharacterized protein LOC128410440 [Podarcis raffonei]